MRRIQLVLLVSIGTTILACQALGPESSPLSRVEQSIIGGKPDNRFPAVGALLGNRRVFCTGALIAPQLVLTAGHCTAAMMGYLKRGIKLEFQVDIPDGQGTKPTYYEVQTQYNHPNYQRSALGGVVNDLGFVLLAKAVSGVTPISVMAAKVDDSWLGRSVLHVGYGVINANPWTVSGGRKHSIDVKINLVSGSKIYTLAAGKSACSGDSGGPVVLERNGAFYVLAVVSAVTGGAQSNGRPRCNSKTVSTSLGSHQRYIESLLALYLPCEKDADCSGCYRCDANTKKCVARGQPQRMSFCGPCQGDKDCGTVGQDRCIRTDAGKRCLQGCDAGACCPAGLMCATVEGQQQCVSIKGSCAPIKCQDSAACGVGEVCLFDTCRPKVVQLAPTSCRQCASDANCGQGACIAYEDGKRCAQPCVGDVFCPKDHTCELLGGRYLCKKTKGVCQCVTDRDCLSGFVCQQQVCLRKNGGLEGDYCDDKRPCSKDLLCGKSRCARKCLPTFPKGSSGGPCDGKRCPEGETCFPSGDGNAYCFRKCSQDGDCINGGRCLQDNTSVPICVCRRNDECRNGTQCHQNYFNNGSCAQPKALPKQCPDGMFCVAVPGDLFCSQGGSFCRQVLNRYVCEKEYSRPLGTKCSADGKDGADACQPGAFCLKNPIFDSTLAPTCLEFCYNGRGCKLGGGTCRSNTYCVCTKDSECNEGFVCQRVGTKTKICMRKSCKTDADCTGGLACIAERCQEKPDCTTSEQCEQGSRCLYGQCQPNQGCFQDGDCPKGQSCSDGRCGAAKPREVARERVDEVGAPDAGGESAEERVGEQSADASPAADAADTIPESTAKKGCGCTTSPTNGPALLWLLCIPFALRRR